MLHHKLENGRGLNGLNVNITYNLQELHKEFWSWKILEFDHMEIKENDIKMIVKWSKWVQTLVLAT